MCSGFVISTRSSPLLVAKGTIHLHTVTAAASCAPARSSALCKGKTPFALLFSLLQTRQQDESSLAKAEVSEERFPPLGVADKRRRSRDSDSLSKMLQAGQPPHSLHLSPTSPTHWIRILILLPDCFTACSSLSVKATVPAEETEG